MKKKRVFFHNNFLNAAPIYAEGQKNSDLSRLIFCLLYTSGMEEIEKQNWNLVPSKYIRFIDHDLEIDFPAEMRRIQAEMKAVMQQEKESQAMLLEAFRGIGYGID